jgi:hypothetical protein
MFANHVCIKRIRNELETFLPPTLEPLANAAVPESSKLLFEDEVESPSVDTHKKYNKLV